MATLPLKLIRILEQMEGRLAEAAKHIVQEQQHETDAPRSQFKLAVEAARQSENLSELQAFLAYQASRDGKVWGNKGKEDNLLFVQRAWRQMQLQIQAYEINAKRVAPSEWEGSSEDDKCALRRVLAEHFFAHIGRTFEIWSAKDKHVRNFYFGLPSQQEETTPVQAREGQGDA
jgi:hypothetical protein